MKKSTSFCIVQTDSSFLLNYIPVVAFVYCLRCLPPMQLPSPVHLQNQLPHITQELQRIFPGLGKVTHSNRWIEGHLDICPEKNFTMHKRSIDSVCKVTQIRARPCCFPVPEAAFLGRLLGQKSWFCPSWRPNATEGANGVVRRQLEVQIEPHSCKILFFYRFWTRRLTLKITPTQVEKRCHWARQAMLFPCSGGSLFGKAFGSEVVVLPVVIPKRNRRCQRCSSKAIGGANWAPQLQNPLFFYRFWTRRLTLKITPTQVEKRCHWARQAMLFPRSGGSLFGKAFGSEVVVLPVVTPKRNGRCQRCSSKAIGGANWAPKLQNPLFL